LPNSRFLGSNIAIDLTAYERAQLLVEDQGREKESIFADVARSLAIEEYRAAVEQLCSDVHSHLHKRIGEIRQRISELMRGIDGCDGGLRSRLVDLISKSTSFPLSAADTAGFCS